MSNDCRLRLRIILLGQFTVLPSQLDKQLQAKGLQTLHCATLASLPEQAGRHDVLCCRYDWLDMQSHADQQRLRQWVSGNHGWVLLTADDTPPSRLASCFALGVSHFLPLPMLDWQLDNLIATLRTQQSSTHRVLHLGTAETALRLPPDIASLHLAALPDALADIFTFRPELLLVDATHHEQGAALLAILQPHAGYECLPAIFLQTDAGHDDDARSRPPPATASLLPQDARQTQLLATIHAQICTYRRNHHHETLRQQRELVSHARLSQLRMAIDEHAIVSIADARGHIEHVNDKFCSISGYDRSELLGQNHRMVKSGIHEPAFYQTLWQTIRSGQPWHGEVCNRRKNGELYWVDATIIPLSGQHGRPVQYISIRTDITALKHSEEALRRSDQRLRMSQSFANIGTWDWDIPSGEVFWSERIPPLFGYPEGAQATSYDHFLLAVHPADREAVVDATNNSLAHDHPYDIEHRVIWPDGQERWLHQRGAVVRDHQGTPLHMLGVVQDIHDKKQADLALARSAQQLQEAQALAKLGNWQLEPHSGAMRCSKEVYRILGQDKARWQPQLSAFYAQIHPEERQQLKDSIRHAAQSGILDAVHRIIRPDGDTRHIHLLAQASCDEHGEIRQMQGTLQDITHIHSTELQLAQHESLLSTILNNTRQGFWFIDTQGITTDINPAMCEILGRPREAIIGHSLFDFVDDANTLIFRKQLAKRQQGLTSPYEIALCRPDGSNVPCINIPSIHYDTHGVPIRFVGIWTNISEMKATQQQLQESNKVLAIARDAAEQANRAKSDFLSSMSHELRTPLNAIIGFTQLLEYDHALNEDQQDSVHEILKAGHHLLQLINEVLDLAKIESGHLALSIEPVALAPLLEDCLQLIQPLATQRQITLHPAGVAPACQVAADRMRLKQVLLNLLSNAVKYNRIGGQICLQWQMGSNKDIHLAISDTGKGMTLAQQAELFQPFNRLDAANSDIEGTGIGLTITRRLLEKMAGDIHVDSQPGVGSTFTIRLPLASQDDEQDSEAPASQDATEASSQQHRLLCIDDNPVNLKLVGQILGMRKSLQLLSAHTPELGIELALAHRPHLILLDINMPGMNGFQVLNILRADKRLKHTPVIAITANAMPRDIERGQAAGFDAYLTKPLDIARFLHTIDQLLAQTEASQP